MMEQYKNLGDYAIKGKMVGMNSPSFGRKQSKETIEKIRKSKIGKPSSLKGKIRTKEVRDKISNSLKGKRLGKNYKEIFGEKQSETIRQKISKSHLGIGHTEETKEKLRLYRLGYKLSDETKKKISVANKGKPHSLEHNRKVSEAIKGEKNYLFGKGYLREGDKNPAWRGGISKEPYDLNWNNRFRKEIRQRDNQVCMNCGIHREKLKRALSVHHINYDKELTIKENCISLCMNCHMLTNINREYWTKLLQDKLSKLYGYEYKEGIIQVKWREQNEEI